MAVYCMEVMHGSFAWVDVYEINSRSVWPTFPAQNNVSVVVGCFSTVILGLSMVDRS